MSRPKAKAVLSRVCGTVTGGSTALFGNGSFAAGVTVSAGSLFLQGGSSIDDAVINALRWRNIGPANMMGRIVDIELVRGGKDEAGLRHHLAVHLHRASLNGVTGAGPAGEKAEGDQELVEALGFWELLHAPSMR